MTKTEEFIEKARQVHGNKYDYSQTEYINTRTPVKIICPEHGFFEQRPKDHLLGHGCIKCSKEKKYKESVENFFSTVKAIHKDKYDYSLAEYKNNKTKIQRKFRFAH